MAHDHKVVGLNPGTVYWMDVSDASYYIINKTEMKVEKWGTPKFFFFLIIYLITFTSIGIAKFYLLLLSTTVQFGQNLNSRTKKPECSNIDEQLPKCFLQLLHKFINCVEMG